MDRLKAMRVLVRAVDAGNLSQASRESGMPLSTVSRLISALEAELGARLLSRSTRAFGLTDAGHDYVSACRGILDDLDRAERLAAGEYHAPRGELAITAPVVFGRLCLMPLIVEFLHAFPDIDIRLLQSDKRVDLFDERIDLALRIGELPDSDLVAVPVGRVRRVVCASPGYLASHGVPATPADLALHTCIAHDVRIAPGATSFDGWDALGGIGLRTRLHVNDVSAAIGAAEQGLGLVRVLRYQVAEAIGAARLQAVLEDAEPAELPVNLVYPSQGTMPLKLRAFVDFVRPKLRQLAESGLMSRH